MDPKLIRVAEGDHLLGDSSKARKELAWRPKVNFERMDQHRADDDLSGSKSETLRI